MKTELTSYIDYYKLSNFFQSILIENTNSESIFGKQLLDSLCEQFGYDKSIFWLSGQEVHTYLPLAHHLEEAAFDDYINHFYRLDPLIPNSTRNTGSIEDIISINDLMPLQEYTSTHYFSRFMAQHNLFHQIVIYLKKKGLIIGGITLFRTYEEGEFTKNDIHLLKKTISFITKLTLNFYVNDKLKTKEHLYEAICNQSPIGIIAFNAYYPYEIRYMNSAVIRYAADILADKYTGNMAEHFIEKHIANTNFDQFGLYKTLISRTSKIYNLSVFPCQATDENNLLAYAYIVPQKSSAEGQNFMHLQEYDFLSSRQIDIIKYVLQGYSNQEISDKLFISVNTVKTHLNKIFKEFQVTSRLSLCSKLTVNVKRV